MEGHIMKLMYGKWILAVVAIASAVVGAGAKWS